MTQSLAIIGAGNIGSRHLQGLQSLPTDINIHVIDPFESALSIARERWEQTGASHTVLFQTEIPKNSNMDCAIIASTADIRAEITRTFIKNLSIKNIIFEKVLFQNPSDYQEIPALLEQKRIKAWVNCPRRVWPAYRELYTTLQAPLPVHVHATGGLWGMACNAIHMLDLIAWLSGTAQYKITSCDLDKTLLQSKRPGFFEFTGSFSGRFENGSTFHIESKDTNNLPFTLMIKSQNGSAILHESSNFYDFFANGAWMKKDLETPYQSQITGDIIKDILGNKKCDLSLLHESVALHIPMIKMFMDHIKITQNKDIESCPIT